MFRHYHADSRYRPRDAGILSRSYDFHRFGTTMLTLVADLVTPEIILEAIISIMLTRYRPRDA